MVLLLFLHPVQLVLALNEQLHPAYSFLVKRTVALHTGFLDSNQSYTDIQGKDQNLNRTLAELIIFIM